MTPGVCVCGVPYDLRPEQRGQGCGSKIEVKSRLRELSLSTSTAGTGVNGKFPSDNRGDRSLDNYLFSYVCVDFECFLQNMFFFLKLVKFILD